MRLININTFDLEEFIGTPENPIPPYVILSHTWGDNEISYSEMMSPTALTVQKEGYTKIKQFAAAVALWTASRNGAIEYVWVDTCCIDKSSSAELSEAINSMYRWYKHASYCYVYLSDVAGLEPDAEAIPLEAQETHRNNAIRDALENCRWMTRGWTLQELLANPRVMFFTRDWELLLTKKDWIPHLSMLLGIGRDVLTTCDPSLASVAQRMSWASRRHTTRAEDMAYCLLGIFDVSMPLLYGEGGERAFVRLQEEIMKSSDDQSLFAWMNLDRQYASCHGLLASSPTKFANCRNISFVDNPEDNAPFSVTNKGLSLRLPLSRVMERPGIYIGLLNCRDPGPDGEPLGIYLIQLGAGQYARVDADELWIAGDGQSPSPTSGAVSLPNLEQFYVRQNIRLPADFLTSDVGGFLITEDITSPDIYLCEASPNVSWVSSQGFIPILAEDRGKQEFLCYSSRLEATAETTTGTVVIILMWDRESQKFGVKFHYNGRRPGEIDIQSRLERKKLLETVGSPIDEFRFYAAGNHRVASADMRLGLMGRLVVIKVAIRIK